MAETSGFFQAMWDDSLTNPITQESNGWWDRSYLAKEFMDYFALFVGNGVFASPTNQLMVTPGIGRTVVVSPGWAFINGGWYHNDTELILELAINDSSYNRIDSVRIRYSDADRGTHAIVLSNEVGVTRGDTLWDLELAQVTVTPNFTSISAASISDMRPDSDVCGFVTGLLEVVSTKDLFAQYQAIFEEWFDGVKDVLEGDVAFNLQKQINDIQNVIGTSDDLKTESKVIVNAINELKDSTDKAFLLLNQGELSFVEKMCVISDGRITSSSLVDVYFTSDTITSAEKAFITVESYDGYLELKAESDVTDTIKASIYVKVV